MNIPTWGELAQLGTLIVTVITLYRSFMNSRAIKENTKSIEIVHKATNSMKDELVAEVRRSEHAQGMQDQKAISIKEPEVIGAVVTEALHGRMK